MGTKIEKDNIYNGYINNDINDARQNLILQLLLAIGNIKATHLCLNSISLFIFLYYSKNQLVLLKN